jgi:hypothetical protein
MEDDWLEAAYEDRCNDGIGPDDFTEGDWDDLADEPVEFVPTEPDCPEFREDGSCIHSTHMAQGGLS